MRPDTSKEMGGRPFDTRRAYGSHRMGRTESHDPGGSRGRGGCRDDGQEPSRLFMAEISSCCADSISSANSTAGSNMPSDCSDWAISIAPS